MVAQPASHYFSIIRLTSGLRNDLPFWWHRIGEDCIRVRTSAYGAEGESSPFGNLCEALQARGRIHPTDDLQLLLREILPERGFFPLFHEQDKEVIDSVFDEDGPEIIPLEALVE